MVIIWFDANNQVCKQFTIFTELKTLENPFIISTLMTPMVATEFNKFLKQTVRTLVSISGYHRNTPQVHTQFFKLHNFLGLANFKIFCIIC